MKTASAAMACLTAFALAAGLLLLAASLRLWDLSALPPGLSDAEVVDIRVAEAVRQGRVEVYYNLAPLGAEGGVEGLYHILLALARAFTGGGVLGYRMLSVAAGMVTLALVYALAGRMYGQLAGLTALGLLAVGMWPALLARTVGPHAFVPFWVAAVMLALALALPVCGAGSAEREPRTAPFAALGLLLGLSFYVHPVGFLLALGALAFIVFVIVSPRRLPPRTLGYAGFAVLFGFIVAVPYVISSTRLPELAGVERLFGDYDITRHPPLQAIFDTIGGLFFVGDSSPVHNLPGRPLLDLVSGVFVLVGLLTALRQARRPRYALPLIMLLALLPAAVFAAAAPDFSAMSALLPPLALLFGLGVATLSSSLRGRARAALPFGLLALLVFNLNWMGTDFFVRWPQLEAVQQVFNGRAGALARYLDDTAGELPTLLCTPAPTGLSPQLTEAQRVLLTMNRPRSALRLADCGTGLVLAQGGERQQVVLTELGGLESIPPPLRRWLESGTPLVSDSLPPNTVIVMDVSNALADQIGLFTTTAPVSYAPDAPGGAQAAVLPVRFGGNITFVGYETNPTRTFKPGDIVTSVTYWRVDGPLPPDMRLFTHVLADPAAIAAQSDTISVRPASLRPRDIFIQVTFVTLLDSTPPGEYDMSVGVYQDSDKTRMPVLDDDNQQRGTRLFLPGNAFTVAGEDSG
ncbi:MAG: glycosyltransferase family 39 protein [Aggregatilineales bacterium]